MEADNQNSWGKIRRDLDQLNEVPGEVAFDTNAVWNKLSDRLEGKDKRKPAFYWAAAAILLLLFSAGWFILQKPNEKKLVHSPSKINPSIKFLPSGTTVAKPNDNKSEETMVFYPQVNSSTKTSTFVPAKKKKRVPAESPSLVAINSQAEPKIEIPVDSITSLPPQSLALVQSPPLKKLKVIHNNQLNSVIYKPELSISNTSSIYPPSPGNIRFSRNASDNIFQIKLSSTN